MIKVRFSKLPGPHHGRRDGSRHRSESVECNGFPHLSHFPALRQCEPKSNFIGLYYLNYSSTCQAKKLNQSSIFRNLFLLIFVLGVYYLNIKDRLKMFGLAEIY
jgi:hypothetical protein